MAKANGLVSIQIGAFIVLAVGAFMIFFLNVQPWLAAAEWIAQDIEVLPFANTLLSLWGFSDTINFFAANLMALLGLLAGLGVLGYMFSQEKKGSGLSGFTIFLIVAFGVMLAGPGDVIAWVWQNLISLTAIFLLVICQTLQLLAWCTETQEARNLLTRVFGGHELGMNDPNVRKKYKLLAGGAYILEGFVCMLEYPPYDGGFTGIMLDFPYLDPSLVSYGEMAKFFITMLSFEGMVTLVVGIITGANPSRSR